MSPSHEWYGVIPGWLPFYLLIAVAVALFVHRAAFLVRLMLKGKPAARWDRVPARLLGVIVNVLGQARLIRGDFWPGLMHATIFWGFIILTLGSIEFFGKGITEAFYLPLLSSNPAYLIMEDVFSLAVIAAIAYAAFRRLVTKPRRLELSAEGLFILLLIFGLMVTDLTADAGRILLAPRRAPPGLSRVSPVLEAPAHHGGAVQRVLRAADPQGPFRYRGSGERGELRDRHDHRVHLEGSLRSLQLHRVRPVHVGLSRQCERQGAGSEVAHPESPGPPARRRAPAARQERKRWARGADGRRGDPRQCPLGLHDLPLVRGCLPRLHRARAEDRGHAAMARSHGVAVPGGDAARLPEPRDQWEPLADVLADAHRLGEGPGRAAHERRQRGGVPLR